MTSVVKTPATCTESGITTYSVSGTYDGFEYTDSKDIQDIPALGHIYSAAYAWSDNGKTCTITISCANDKDHGTVINGTATSVVKIPATCTEVGITTYSVSGTYDGFAYADSKDIQDIPALGHDYHAEFVWSDDGKTCTVNITCSHDAFHGGFVAGTVNSKVTVPATCDTAGTTTYYVTAEFDGKTFEDSKSVQNIPALGHIYSAAYAWSDDGKTCTITITCANDKDHGTVINGTVTSVVKIPATCTEVGITTYSVSGTYDGFAYADSKDVTDIPALGHDYSATYEWSSDGKSCKVVIVCAVDSTHSTTLDAVVASSVKVDATTSSMGVTTYSVSGTYDGFAYSDNKEVTDIPALEPVSEEKESISGKTYGITVTENVTTEVSSIFNTAKDNNASVEISVATTSAESPVIIIFDNAAVKAIGGNDVTITANLVSNSTVISDAEIVLEVTLDGAKFSDGKATVYIPYSDAVPAGKTVKVYFVNGSDRTDMNATLSNGYIVFETNHFSSYAVVLEDVPSDGNGNGSEFPILYAAIGAIAVLALAGGAVVIKKRKA